MKKRTPLLIKAIGCIIYLLYMLLNEFDNVLVGLFQVVRKTLSNFILDDSAAF